MNIRNSAKAVILKDSQLLLTKNRDAEGSFYIFPGGGQDHGEALTNTVIRECLEEVGAFVKVGQLLHIREYIGKNHEHHAFDASVHQIEYYFLAELLHDENEWAPPTNPDSNQVGIEWVEVAKLADYRIYPKAIVPALQNFVGNKQAAVYLGDVN